MKNSRHPPGNATSRLVQSYWTYRAYWTHSHCVAPIGSIGPIRPIPEPDGRWEPCWAQPCSGAPSDPVPIGREPDREMTTDGNWIGHPHGNRIGPVQLFLLSPTFPYFLIFLNFSSFFLIFIIVHNRFGII